MEKIIRYAEERGISLYRALLEAEQIGLAPRFLRPLQSFAALIRDLHGMAEYLSARELTEEVLEKTGYRESLEREGTLEAEGRLENIGEFLSVVQEFEQRSEEKSLVDFLTDLALLSDIDTLDEEAEGDAVVLMTLTAPRGWNFPASFSSAWKRGCFPTSVPWKMTMPWRRSGGWLMWGSPGRRGNCISPGPGSGPSSDTR